MRSTSRKMLVIATTVAIAAAASVSFSQGDERARICRPGAATAGRPSPDAWLKLRQQVFARAGVSFPAHHADCTVDHIVPRCLDGSNTLDNLQLQTRANAVIKDHLEVETCRAYCAGSITIDQARSRFARQSSPSPCG